MWDWVRRKVVREILRLHVLVKNEGLRGTGLTLGSVFVAIIDRLLQITRFYYESQRT
jgi:hypothetical protein